MLPHDFVEEMLRRQRERSRPKPVQPQLELPLPRDPHRETTRHRVADASVSERGVVVIDLLG